MNNEMQKNFIEQTSFPDARKYFSDQALQIQEALMLYNCAIKEVRTKLEILNDEFQHVHRYNPIEHIKSRIKSSESIVKKLRRNGHESTIENMVEHVNDIAGIRVICSFSSAADADSFLKMPLFVRKSFGKNAENSGKGVDKFLKMRYTLGTKEREKKGETIWQRNLMQ